MSVNPLRDLASRGQRVWLDDLHRGLVQSGELARLIREDGLTGLTSNPAILAQAFRARAEYRDAVHTARGRGESPLAIVEALAIADVQAAADSFRPVYEATAAQEGYVSMEVSPHLADDAPGTVVEAMALWKRIGRPNAMIKVPATLAGLEAIPEILAAGVNVNATLLFSPHRQAAVIEAFFDAMEVRLRRGEPLQGVASVASFFVSRIDTAVDAHLDAMVTTGSSAAQVRSLRGQAAFACAGRAYDAWLSATGTARWARLARAGARMQRLLWASTSTKDPSYRDVRYVEDLVAAHTINTMPSATLAAFRDHGTVGDAFDGHRANAEATVAALRALGVDVEEIAARLEREGVRKFIEPFEALERWLAEQGGE